MRSMDAGKVVRTWQQIDAFQKQWDNLWEEVAFYCQPSKVGFLTKNARGGIA